MDEQFDNELKNRIREVFENFEDNSADEGWLLLREKFPEKEKDRGIAWLWWGSAAAILLILLGIGTRVNFNKKDQSKKFSYKPVKTFLYKNKNDTIAEYVKNGNRNIAKNRIKHTLSKDSAGIVNHTNRSSIAANIAIKKTFRNINKNMPTGKTTRIASNPKPGNGNSVTSNPTLAQVADQIAATSNSVANPATVANDTTVKKNLAVVPQKEKTPFVIGGKSDELKFTQPPKKTIAQKKVEFSIYAATYFNYAKGSNNQLNLGAGVTADIRFSKNIKLSTGILIAQNTLNYSDYTGNNSPFNSPQVFLATVPAFGANPSSNNSSNTTYNIITDRNYNAQLIDLDVPVNLKYEFEPGKNNNYFAIGFSSGTFINQSYSYQYTSNGATQSQTTTNSFSDFYFAKTVNLSLGLGYPIGKNHFVIEPFLKYPLQGMGEQQIKFGSGGINLKFDLQPSKK